MSAYDDYLANMMKEATKKSGILTNAVSFVKLPTECLALNYLLNGGMCSGLYTFSGLNSTGKTTMALLCAMSFKRSHNTRINYFDVEKGIAPAKAKAIVGLPPEADDLDVIPCIDAYSQEGILEKITDTCKFTLDLTPTKVMINKKWYWVFDKNNNNLKALCSLGLDYDRTLTAAYNKYVCPLKADSQKELEGFQHTIIIDSISTAVPSLQVKGGETYDKRNRSVGLDARVITEEMKPIVGMLGPKNSVLISINQLRSDVNKAMFAPGSRYYDPGAEFMRYAMTSRIEFAENSIPYGLSGMQAPGTTYKDSYIGGEPCVDDPNIEDRYSNKIMKVTKNRQGVDIAVTARFRMWSQYNKLTKRTVLLGLDPVFDVFETLLQLGWVKPLSPERTANFIYGLEKIIPGLNRITWNDFKSIILCEVNKCNNKELKEIVLKKYLTNSFTKIEDYPSIYDFTKKVCSGSLTYCTDDTISPTVIAETVEDTAPIINVSHPVVQNEVEDTPNKEFEDEISSEFD